MLFFVIIGIAMMSILLALVSLQKQSKLDEVKKVKRKLKNNKVIFYRDSSSSS